VLEVQHAAYAIEAELIGYPQLPPLHETLEGLRATPEELWLCEEGGELCGVVGLEQHADELVIARLFVAPAAFRRGIGSALVGQALARADGRRVRVGTGARNLPALALYERFGFRRLPEREPVPDVGYVELVRDP
jgi:ribosomal protein S18 acetylase RimI-like enzyme